MISKNYGDVHATSYAAEGTIFLRQGESSISISPDQLRAILNDHSPEGFYDDLPGEEQYEEQAAEVRLDSPEAILGRIVENHGNYIMTTEEAVTIWEQKHALVKENPQGSVVLLLADHLERELNTGARCAVCGRYQSPDCAESC